jgi:hypothetical protein
MELDPPNVLPCGYQIERSSRFLCGTVKKRQLTPGPNSLPIPPGIWIMGFQSRLPASSSKTFTSGSSDKRLASTQPAEPAPTMM